VFPSQAALKALEYVKGIIHSIELNENNSEVRISRMPLPFGANFSIYCERILISMILEV